MNSVTDIARGLKIEHHFAFIQIHSIHIILKETKKKKTSNIIITMDVLLTAAKRKAQHVDSQEDPHIYFEKVSELENTDP